MTAKALLNHFVGLRDELLEQGQSPSWVVRRRLANTILKLCRAQVLYARLCARGKVSGIAFFEDAQPFTDEDLHNIWAAAAVNGEIRKHLSGLRQAETRVIGRAPAPPSNRVRSRTGAKRFLRIRLPLN